MSLVSLYSNEHGFLATDQLVFTADQIHQLQDAAAMVEELSTALADQNQINESARSAGFNAGFEQGSLQAVAEHAAEFKQTLVTLHQAYQCDVAAQQETCAALAIDVVRKIAGQIAPADWLYAEASTAAAELVDQTGLVLRVHSSQFAGVSERVINNAVFERVIADESVAPDACSIDTRYGKIDVDLETQIDRVLALFSAGDSSRG